jgi:hypothetical protein
MYKVVCTIEFPHHTEYVIWEPEFLGQMMYKGIDIESIFYNTEKNGFIDAPVNVLIELYKNPTLLEIPSKNEGELQQIPLLVGEKVLPILSL